MFLYIDRQQIDKYTYKFDLFIDRKRDRYRTIHPFDATMMAFIDRNDKNIFIFDKNELNMFCMRICVFVWIVERYVQCTTVIVNKRKVTF